MFDQLVVLYSHINFWKFFLVSVVEVALFDPFVHQSQRNLIFLIFVFSYFIVVVCPSGFVHELTAAVPASLNDVNNKKNKEADVEEHNYYESKPTKSVVVINAS